MILSVNISFNHPLTRITWTSKLNLLDDRIDISNSHMVPTQRSPVISAIQISSVAVGDAGTYIVTAANEVDMTSLQLEVVVSGG